MPNYTDIDLVRDSTLQDVAESLRIIAGVNRGEVTNFHDVAHYIVSGNAEHAFPIGDQLIAKWTDKSNNVDYLFPFNIVDYDEAILADGERWKSMVLQAAYTPPFGVQMSNYQAFYVAETEILPAGTYNVTMGLNWGTHVVNGKTYQFTLTQDLPVGGQLTGFNRAPDVAPSSWTVKSHVNSATAEAIETVSVTEGSAGVSLGTFTAAGSETLNSIHQVAYGSNIYYLSAVRQWLNSMAGVGAWWTPMSKWDRVPDQLATKSGFLSGFEEDFLGVLIPSQITTKLNNVTEYNKTGVPEIMYDKMYLPSKEEMFATPQVQGEGHAFPYWKQALGRTEPSKDRATYPEYISYSIANKNSAQTLRWRSGYVGYGDSSWCSHTSGYVNHTGAVYAHAFLPVCKIGMRG